MTFAYDRDLDPNRSRDDVHYRHYLGRDGEPTVVCVQWFDYYDYEDERFLSYEAYATEAEAEKTLPLVALARALDVPHAALDASRRARVERQLSGADRAVYAFWLPLRSLLSAEEASRLEASGLDVDELQVGYSGTEDEVGGDLR